MLTILALSIGSLIILVMLLLVTVVIGIRQEPPTEELNEQAPSLVAAFVRRLLGTYVRKPDSLPNLDLGDESHSSPHTTPLVGQWTSGGGEENFCRRTRWSSDTVGHKSTHVTETVYRHVIVPEIRGGATVMDDLFDEDEALP